MLDHSPPVNVGACTFSYVEGKFGPEITKDYELCRAIKMRDQMTTDNATSACYEDVHRSGFKYRRLAIHPIHCIPGIND